MVEGGDGMSYEFQRQDVYDFAATLPTEKKEKGGELFFLECPYCKGGKHHDKNTFSINLETGTFHCFRASCGKSGHFVELARDFGFPLDFGEAKQYKRLPQKKIETRPAAVAYLEGRGISRAITEKYCITTAKDRPDILVFPFFDENNVMQFVKYRNTKPKQGQSKEWSEANAKPILFGMAQCTGRGPLVITEGQMDSLSLAECGIENAVSVPNGAHGFTWVRHCLGWLEQFEEIIVFGDCENGHITLVEELQARLSKKLRVVQAADYLGEKDANDILQKYGREAVCHAVQNAAVPKLKNIKELSEVKTVDLEGLPRIKTGLTPLDRTLGGLYLGQVSLLSGKRGQGKSTLASQIVAEALGQGWNVFVYSGELPDYHFKRWLDLQLAGKANLTEQVNAFGEKCYSIPPAVQEKLNRWYRGRAFLYDNGYLPEGGQEMEALPKTIEKAIRQYDIKLVCIDNLMTAMAQVDEKADLYTAQSNFVWSLKRIAMKYNVHILLVAHPRKTGVGEMGNDDVSGSGDITNKVDTVLFYNRKQDDDSGGQISVTKNRLTGKLAVGKNTIETAYSRSCKRIVAVGDPFNRAYGWEEKTAYEGFESLQEGAEWDAECPF